MDRAITVTLRPFNSGVTSVFYLQKLENGKFGFVKLFDNGKEIPKEQIKTPVDQFSSDSEAIEFADNFKRLFGHAYSVTITEEGVQ